MRPDQRMEKIMHRLLCWLGVHEWAYSLRDDDRCCVVCSKRQYVALFGEGGAKTWETEK